jgi:hypothetical protein
MTTAHVAVGQADCAVGVDLRLTIDEAHVADERDHFHLLIDGDVAIGLMFEVEPAELCALQRADGGEMTRGDLPLCCEGGQAGEHFVPFPEAEGVSRFSVGLLGNFAHPQAGASLRSVTGPGLVYLRGRLLTIAGRERARPRRVRDRSQGPSGSSGDHAARLYWSFV